MKNLGKLAVLGAVIAASTSFAFADQVLVLGSFGATGLLGYSPLVTVNNTEMQYVGNQLEPTVAAIPATPTIAPISPINATNVDSDGVWHAPLTNSSWVGINANAGPLSTTDPQFGYYDFQTTFSALGGVYGGTLNVLADDTTEVLLNGVLISGLGFGNLGSDSHCADNVPTCLVTDPVAVSLNLLSGTNKLDFIVKQAGIADPGNNPSGVDFAGTLTQTPEPSSLMLIGTGLVGAAGMLFRRRVTA